MAKINAAERKQLDIRIKKRKDGWRRRYKEIRGKKVDYVTHSYEDGWVYIVIYFQDGTNFSLDFSINDPAIVPRAIEYGEIVDGDYQNIRTYYFKGDN